MKKILIATFVMISLSACSGKKDKSKTAATGTETSTGTETTSTGTETSPDDKPVADWLQGKEWKAEDGMAPMSFLRLYADGRCEYGTSKDTWSYRKGAFGIHMNNSKNPIVTWPVQKVDEQSFSLYVEPTKKTYIYKFVKAL